MRITFVLFSISAVSAFAADSTIIADLRAKMKAGDIDAQIKLAHIYNRGQGIIRSDFLEAERLLRPLAEKGNARAQLELGYLYNPDDGRLRNFVDVHTRSKLDELKKKVVEFVSNHWNGDSLQFRVGDSAKKITDYDNWTTKEYNRFVVPPFPGSRVGPYLPDSIRNHIHDSIQFEMSSEQWFLKAANQGLPEAMCELAWLMETAWASRGVHDELYWYEKAAQLDYTHAQGVLGELYSFQYGGKRNMPRAYFWLKIASDKNDKRTRTNFERIKKEITSEQLQEAQKLLDEWHKRKEN